MDEITVDFHPPSGLWVAVQGEKTATGLSPQEAIEKLTGQPLKPAQPNDEDWITP